MSEYRYRSTGEVKTQGQIRSDHPNTSLPKVWTAATCDGLGIDPVQAQKDAYDAANTASLAAQERSKRDLLLAETDHYGLSDVTMSDDMTTYRQALRDVPQQETFPQEITWPTKPTE